MRYVHRYLLATKTIEREYENIRNFLQLLYKIWFAPYRRRAANDSSGFEHVFVGERKRGKVTGFHNWLQFYHEERKRELKFLSRMGHTTNQVHTDQLVTLKFRWKGDLKPCGSVFVGVSPEYEVALYSLCFFLGKETMRARCGPYHVEIKTFRMGSGKRAKIGTAFPKQIRRYNKKVKNAVKHLHGSTGGRRKNKNGGCHHCGKTNHKPSQCWTAYPHLRY
jgi:poly(U)-specific endoribonuclease